MAVDVSWLRSREGVPKRRSEFSTASAGGRAGSADDHTPFGSLLAAGLILAAAFLDAYAMQQFHNGGAVSIAQENGLLENIQLVATLMACALFGFAGLKGAGAVRVSGVALALLVAAAFIREVDFKSLTGMHATLDWMIAQGLRDWIFELLGVAAVVFLLTHLRYFWGFVRLGLRWQAWPFVTSVALLAVAEFYLDGLTVADGHFREELVETNGYILFVLAAWKHVQLIGHRELDVPVPRRREEHAATAERAAV
jgi:hypothetical protein